jgi:AcrR family transcriptional regulator
MTAADQSIDDSPRRTRLRAADRKQLILEAARRAFSASGDVRGTTIKQIADEAGISEGIIYRYFASKDELFVEAAVAPLTAAVQASLEKIAQFDLNRVGPDLHELSVRYYAETIDAIADLIPLLGLVLFGDPQYAVPFYRDVLAPALEEVRKSWDTAYRRETGEPFPSKLSASTHFGALLMLALEQRLAERPPSSRRVAKDMVALEEHRLMSIINGALGRRTASKP